MLSPVNKRGASGVTLLEVLLALSLSVVVLTAIGWAISLYFRMLDVRRTSLEEMQVVRVITQRMTQDIRMMVPPYEPDMSGIETAFANAMQAASKQASNAAASAGITIGGNTGTTPGSAGAGGAGANAQAQGGGAQAGGQSGQTGGGGGGQTANAGKTGGSSASSASASKTGAPTGGAQAGKTGGAASGATSSAKASGSDSGGSTSASASTTQAAANVGPSVQLIGSATELRFDVSRIPRIDQYKGILASNGDLSPIDLPSDVKTIAYFIRSESSSQTYRDNPQAAGGEASTDGYGRGLMRAELDRAVAAYAESGGTADVYSTAQLMADEVVGLGFEYYDGVEWLTDWDSTSKKALPRAVRVWLSVQPTYGMSENEIAQSAKGKEVPSTDFYFVISLPTAPLVATTPTESTESTDAAAASSTSSSSSSSSSSSTGTTP